MAKLKTILPKKSGRSNGTVTTRHQGGRHKRFMRAVDFKRNKVDIWATVEVIEYDPNRNTDIALVAYEDGERRYILAPEGLEVGAKVISSDAAPLDVGNALPLRKIPAGTEIHNIEITPGKGAQMVKTAGSYAVVQGAEEEYILVRLPSAEIRRFRPEAMATIGQLGNAEIRTVRARKAGTMRRRGIRPRVRGVAQNPHSHAHGGGEGRSGIGLKYPKTYKGRPAVGRTRRSKKYSNKYIVKRRKAGKHQQII